MVDYESRPIKKSLWVDKIEDIVDVRLFYYHLLLDLDIRPGMNTSVRELRTDDNKPVFTDKGASVYDKLLKDSFELSGIPRFVLDGIWPELDKWGSDNDEAIKRIPIISASSGKLMYEAGFKSAFPAMSVLYAVDSSNGNKQYQKTGYGTINYLVKPHETEHFYKIYDNESKKYFDGVLYKSDDGNFEISIDIQNE
jgi:hypothetical protein